MFRVTRKKRIAENIYRISVLAPHIAAKRKAGQFVIVVPSDGGERVPLTIMTSDVEAGTIDLDIGEHLGNVTAGFLDWNALDPVHGVDLGASRVAELANPLPRAAGAGIVAR